MFDSDSLWLARRARRVHNVDQIPWLGTFVEIFTQLLFDDFRITVETERCDLVCGE